EQACALRVARGGGDAVVGLSQGGEFHSARVENANCKPNLTPMAKSKKAKRLDELAAQIRVCTRCPLHESRTIAVPGDGKYTAKIMIIAEAPGKEEDETGKPFVGPAGRYLA